MTEKYYNTHIYGTDDRTFRGLIYNYDFEGPLTMSDIAKRIIADWRFNEKCSKNTENREKDIN